MKKDRMEPKILSLKPKKLIGISMEMSFVSNSTGELWKTFMPRRKEISGTVGSDCFSIQNYPADFFDSFDPNRTFRKWAAVEVSNCDGVPEGMEQFILPSGLYAVFHYHGDPRDAARVFQYILGQWLPSSGYKLDNRPHFEILGEKYKNNDPDSEEEIWIPICPR